MPSDQVVEALRKKVEEAKRRQSLIIKLIEKLPSGHFLAATANDLLSSLRDQLDAINVLTPGETEQEKCTFCDDVNNMVNAMTFTVLEYSKHRCLNASTAVKLHALIDELFKTTDKQSEKVSELASNNYQLDTALTMCQNRLAEMKAKLDSTERELSGLRAAHAEAVGVISGTRKFADIGLHLVRVCGVLSAHAPIVQKYLANQSFSQQNPELVLVLEQVLTVCGPINQISTSSADHLQQPQVTNADSDEGTSVQPRRHSVAAANGFFAQGQRPEASTSAANQI